MDTNIDYASIVQSILNDSIDIIVKLHDTIEIVATSSYIIDQADTMKVEEEKEKQQKKLNILQQPKGVRFRYLPLNRKRLEKNWTSLIPNIRRFQFQKAFIRHKQATVRLKIGQLFDHIDKHGDNNGKLTQMGMKRALTLHMHDIKKTLDKFPVLQAILKPKYFSYAILRMFEENAITKSNFINFVLKL